MNVSLVFKIITIDGKTITEESTPIIMDDIETARSWVNTFKNVLEDEKHEHKN